mgnify:CR=1 FL=1
MSSEIGLDQAYLQAALSWLDARLELIVRRWQLAGQDPSDRFRGLHISDEKALELVQPVAIPSLPEKEEKALQKQEDAALEEMQKLEKKALDSGFSPRLKALQNIFDITSFDWWAWIICLAPALDLRYERIYGYLQDDVTQTAAGTDLILNLLLPEAYLSRLEYLPAFSPQGSLRASRLLILIEGSSKPASNLRQAFRVSTSLVNWLFGEYIPSARLGTDVEFYPSAAELPDAELVRVFAPPELPPLESIQSLKPLISLYGTDHFRQDMAVGKLASELELPLLKVKIQPTDEEGAALEKLSIAVRDAKLLQALLYIQGMDVFISGEGTLLPAAFQIVEQASETVLLASKAPFRLGADMQGNDTPLLSVAFTGLTAVERTKLWEELLDGASDSLLQKDVAILAGQFNLSSGQIIAASSTAMSEALQAQRGLEMDDLFKAARLHSGHHLADLARKMEPRYVWEDLILPETPLTMLKEMVSMVQSRPMVLETWGLGRKLTSGAGIAALFAGPPGTGKTLAAQIMANRLGIDLYRIDLSSVVSKYVGETEKQLEQIFTEASQSNAILFFDEADSIFGKRSEVKGAHDRYANIEVSYLLQRMEDYDGVAILATNLRANLDEAFTRRLQFIVNFPFPDEEYRRKIWEVLMPPSLPRVDDLDFGMMAGRFKLSGGSIRNIIVSAAYFAAANGGEVNMTHLMHGARREFQKMGRLVQESDFLLPSL